MPVVPTVPKFPNWNSVVGSSAPVVTTLFSGICSAVFIAVFQPGFTSGKLFLWHTTWESKNAAILFGIISMSLFISATIALLYSQASSFDLLPTEQKEALFATSGIQDSRRREQYINEYRKYSRNLLIHSNVLVLGGVSFLLLTLEALIYGHVYWISYFISLLSIAISFLLTKQNTILYHRIFGFTLFIINVCFLVSMFFGAP